jgi:hypothetical protein
LGGFFGFGGCVDCAMGMLPLLVTLWAPQRPLERKCWSNGLCEEARA